MPNYNTETGIPFGTIYLNNLDPDTASWLWTEGIDLSYEEAYEDAKAEIRSDIDQEIQDGTFDPDEDDIEDEIALRLENLDIQIDEPTIEGEYEGVKYMISWLGAAPLLWVFESPFTGRYHQCSPCVPGAGDLDSPDEDGELCYDVPPDWRRKE